MKPRVIIMDEWGVPSVMREAECLIVSGGTIPPDTNI